MRQALLATKLHIPPTRAELVPRPRLIEQLNEGLHRKLTLISAPAGFGKTTLVSKWVNDLRLHVANGNRIVDTIAWFSVDDRDTDPVRFLTYFIGALDRAKGNDAAIGKRAMGMLQSPYPPPAEVVLTSLINDVTGAPDRILLVLDDYHTIAPSQIDEALTFLLEYLPTQLHLVVVTREDPQLPLARLRARGELIEVRAVDLRFSFQEAAEFLGRTMRLNLSAEDVLALESRTEGWIAGLHLAAISMQGHEDPSSLVKSFTGSHRFVLDYLIEEVVEQQPPSIQTFLLQTAVLNRLTGSLCDALTGLDSGRATLEMLEHANLLIVPLDEERHWYRYHHLFIELLRQRLRQKQPDWIPGLHERASEWYGQNGFTDEAIEHALCRKDFERAADMVQDYTDDIWKLGERTRLQRWLDEIPVEVTFSRPHLCILRAVILYASGQVDEAERLLQVAEQALAPSVLPTANPRSMEASQPHALDTMKLLGRAAVVRSHLLSYWGDAEGSLQSARQALDYLPQSDSTWLWSAFDSMGTVYSGKDDVAAYHARLQALESSKAGGHVYMVLLASLRLVVTLRDLGRLQLAIELCQQQLKLANENDLSQSALVGWLYTLWAEILAERNQLDHALQLANRGIALTERGKDAILRGSGYLCLMRVLFSKGEMQIAEAIIRKLNHVTPQQELSPWITNQLAAWQARIWVAQDKLDSAAFWAEECAIDLNGDVAPVHDFDYAVLARVLTAQGRPKEASRLLQRLLEPATAGGRTSKVIEILTLQALAFRAGGDTDRAIAALERALSLAEPGDFIRIFLDEGPPMAHLLYEALQLEINPDYVRRLLAAFPIVEQAQPVPPVSDRPESDWIEPLSERELEVLQLIAAGLTNPEIAARLFLALNTVKAHTRNIYGKLGAHNRTQAVARAKALGMLSVA